MVLPNPLAPSPVLLALVLIFVSCQGLSNLPASELINRRKSPALWRDDLTASRPTDNEARRLEQRPLPLRPPEIMSPVGGWPQLRAAVGNGADSVYLGLSSYSARARAANFNPHDGELAEAVKFAHTSGVKVYVALNTLVFDHELKEVESLIHAAKQAGVDALIVQDMGIARLVQEIAPGLEVHASTQQTITSADGAAFAAERSGATRIVLGRELSVKEIEAVTDEMDIDGVEVEAFVHGALCVSYSGQCFSSEAWGGRSANRGQCAQACRLPYGLIVDGELRDLKDMQYLLSPQDLCGLEQVPDLVRAGISCLKIEGRLKDEAYVAATTRAYRNAVDEAWEALTNENAGASQLDAKRKVGNTRAAALESTEFVTKAELTQLFSRGQDKGNDGLSPGFFEGSRHQRLVRGRSPRHRGVYIGQVEEGSSPRNGIVLSGDMEIVSSLKRGDGVVIDRGEAEEFELGGPIFDVQNAGEGVVIRFGKEVERKWKRTDEASRKGMGSRTPLVPVGAYVWKTSDSVVDKKMRRLSEAAPPRALATVSVSGKEGEPLVVKVTDISSRKFGVGASLGVLTPAKKAGLVEKSIKKAIGTLGNTHWAIHGEIDLNGLEEGMWCPVSWLKEARRHAINELESVVRGDSSVNTSPGAKAENSDDDSDQDSSAYLRLMCESAISDDHTASSTRVSVLARTFDQVDAVCSMVEDAGDFVDEIIVDFLEVDGMKEAVDRIREAHGVRVVLASPRIIKPGEEGIWRTLLRLEPDGLLVRSTGLLHRMSKLGGTGATVDVGGKTDVTIPELLGDFSLNVANALTALELLDTGLSRITAGYDLSASAISELAKTLGGGGAGKLEVVAHAHLPIFHTEHCVFARFLSNGNSYLDCGHACTRCDVHLRDQSGSDNLVLADMGCRNTVFTAQAQSGVHSIGEWADAGVGRIRIELIDENPEDSAQIVRGYVSVLSGEERPSVVWESLKQVKDSNGRAAGVSLGSLRNGVERRAGEIE